MSFLFKSKSRGASELVAGLQDELERLADPKVSDSDHQPAEEQVSKTIGTIKTILAEGSGPEWKEACRQIKAELISRGIVRTLLSGLGKINFESRKDIHHIFAALFYDDKGVNESMVEYLVQHGEIMESLMEGYRNPEIALLCGLSLRECFRHEKVAERYMDLVFELLQLVRKSNFDMSSDAFATIRELLKPKDSVAGFLEINYDRFFSEYTLLLTSDNYLTRRQSLKLLGELLMEKANFGSMMRFINVSENLKLTMNLLRDSSRNIQFEAFNIFKIFVANPHKPRPITDILEKNRDQLLEFLAKFQSDRTDPEFSEEKAYIIKEIDSLGA